MALCDSETIMVPEHQRGCAELELLAALAGGRP
jgi:hypothetical protein